MVGLWSVSVLCYWVAWILHMVGLGSMSVLNYVTGYHGFCGW